MSLRPMTRCTQQTQHTSTPTICQAPRDDIPKRPKTRPFGNAPSRDSSRRSIHGVSPSLTRSPTRWDLTQANLTKRPVERADSTGHFLQSQARASGFARTTEAAKLQKRPRHSSEYAGTLWTATRTQAPYTIPAGSRLPRSTTRTASPHRSCRPSGHPATGSAAKVQHSKHYSIIRMSKASHRGPVQAQAPH